MNLSDLEIIDRPARPALELISLARLSPELARQNLRSRLLADPDYFGRITENSLKAVLRIQKDTTYESLCDISYSPRFEQLQVSINIHQCSGYSGTGCRYGSEEFVRVYLSYDAGLNWHDQGLAVTNAFDMTGPKPMQFGVSVSIRPAQTFCFMQDLPTVRAILSWNAEPPAGSPEWTPVWGDVMEAQLRIVNCQDQGHA